jgi:hypothetical protein
MSIGPLPLVLRTQTQYFDACDDALLQPVRFMRLGEEAVFMSVAGKDRVEIVWPKDFRARLVNGRSELLDSFGVIVAVEDDVLDNVGGSGDPFNACWIAGRYYR